MELVLRLLVYLVLGLLLLVGNIWFLTSVRQSFAGGSYVIRPFVIIGPTGQESSERAGYALAQMTVSRLATLQDGLRESQISDSAKARPRQGAGSLVPVTVLFVPRQVDIPASLFEPVDIKATVAGVEIGGVIAWFRRLFSSDRGLNFTVYQRDDHAIISADLGRFTSARRHIWLKSGKDPDEIATNIAYAMIWLKLRENHSSRISELDFQQFREILQTLTEVDKLNRQVARGHVVETRFLELLAPIEARVLEIPHWPELLYLAASIADGAANRDKALSYYQALARLAEADRGDASPEMFRTAAIRQEELEGRVAGGGQDGEGSEAELRFILEASEFARQMSLKGPDPQIVFVKPKEPAIQAIWNDQAKHYEVNPQFTTTAGLPQYVALMGRFLSRNIARCFPEGEEGKVPIQFWNNFRLSLVDYLVRSVPAFKNVTIYGDNDLYRALRRIEAASGVEATQRLALELLDRFDCDWTESSLEQRMLQINRERGLMADGVISKAMAARSSAQA